LDFTQFSLSTGAKFTVLVQLAGAVSIVFSWLGEAAFTVITQLVWATCFFFSACSIGLGSIYLACSTSWGSVNCACSVTLSSTALVILALLFYKANSSKPDSAKKFLKMSIPGVVF
jgi:hypothetical protein